MRPLTNLFAAFVFVLLSTAASGAQPGEVADLPPDEIGRTPPRMSFVDGEVSFFRPGDPGWTSALVNTALAPGDRLRAGAQGSLELQIGARSFLRAWENGQVDLKDQDLHGLRFEVNEGNAALDLRDLEAGLTVEVYTPHAAFAVTRDGYYRVTVSGKRTEWTVRRGGQAFVVPVEGDPFDIGPEEEIVLAGYGGTPAIPTRARARDRWDQWNDARTEYALAGPNPGNVPAGVYGAGDLDRHGRWQAEPEYGPVWVPQDVPPGWAPYSAGVWMHDPYYGWTWVDAAPWGWAPFHHGRWVHLGGRWCWAPGPRVARPVYAPALVAFFSGPQSGVVVGIPGPSVGWVALGWGEPCVPWWGRPGFARRPWWGGWGGPRVVNNVVIHRTTVVHADHIHSYRNTRVRHAVFSAPGDRFAHRDGAHGRRFEHVDTKDLRPMHSGPSRRLAPVGFQPPAPRGIHPQANHPDRPADGPPPHRGGQDWIGHAPGSRGETPAPGPDKRSIAPTPRPDDRGQRQPGTPGPNPGRIQSPAVAPQTGIAPPAERGDPDRSGHAPRGAGETPAPGPDKRRISPVPRPDDRSQRQPGTPGLNPGRTQSPDPSARITPPSGAPGPASRPDDREQRLPPAVPELNPGQVPAPSAAPQPRIALPAEGGGPPQRPAHRQPPRAFDRRAEPGPAPAPSVHRTEAPAEVRRPPQGRPPEHFAPARREERPASRPDHVAGPRQRPGRPQPSAEYGQDRTNSFQRGRP
jgi:hypothetical protein